MYVVRNILVIFADLPYLLKTFLLIIAYGSGIRTSFYPIFALFNPLLLVLHTHGHMNF